MITASAQRIGWVSRWPVAVIIGVYAGLKTTGFAQGDFVAQVQATLQPVLLKTPWETVSVIVFTIGLMASLMFFFFSREHRGTLGVVSRIGMYFLMVGFGA